MADQYAEVHAAFARNDTTGQYAIMLQFSDNAIRAAQERNGRLFLTNLDMVADLHHVLGLLIEEWHTRLRQDQAGLN